MDRLFIGDALEALKQIPSETVDTCVTSPPYYGLRDYGADGQIGLEKTPDEYIDRLVDVFHEVKRTLKKDGTLWIVISDSYAGSGKGAANYPDNAKKYKQGTNRGMLGASATTKIKTPGIKAKDLIGIPWMLAFALRADGWYLRSDIIWHKPNVMPESVKDRCPAHTNTYSCWRKAAGITTMPTRFSFRRITTAAQRRSTREARNMPTESYQARHHRASTQRASPTSGGGSKTARRSRIAATSGRSTQSRTKAHTSPPSRRS